MEHKELRVALHRTGEVPQDVEREYQTLEWASALYSNALRIAAASVLLENDSLAKAASLLWWSGFAVPQGYFSEDEADALPGLESEEALRAWVERDEENIRRAFGSVGFHLAGIGSLMNPKEEYLSGE